MALPQLTDKEIFVWEFLKNYVQEPIPENALHMMFKIACKLSGDNSYRFEEKYWPDIDKRFPEEGVNLPYSQELHDRIESLISKGYLERDSGKPINLNIKNIQL